MIDRPRVLIIDEDRRMVDQLQEYFNRSGYEAEVALSPTVGLSIIEERRMSLTGLNGEMGLEGDWALVRRLKQFDPAMPLVLFNGPKTKDIAREARRLGVSRVLAQPAQIETVMAEAMKVLKK